MMIHVNRDLLGSALLRLAHRRMSRNSAEDPALWAMIRRGSSLLRPEDMGRILPFLAPGLSPTIHQVAIQAVESKATIAIVPIPQAVTDRVVELAQLYVAKAVTGDGGAEVDALASGAVASAVLAQAVSAPQLVATIIQPRAPEIPEAAALAASLRAAGERRRS